MASCYYQLAICRLLFSSRFIRSPFSFVLPPNNPEEKKEDYTVRKNAKETVEVAELRLRFYTLTMPNDDMAEEKFRQAFQKSEFFQNDKEGFSILSYDGGSGKSKDNLKSFVVLVKLKEPLKK